ncbi:exonuclease SbcCD subunit D [Arthrobacter sp. VKM Ac-2550]|uniref:exonuclease SbcCD subunit D n=1 Tax=Crystallibacter permensis TaxID=1938888 RepID=UPI0022272C29|nr:exonuclease SbcCD subunit D [Arthrobacter sp. VKM Ac-2550]MCW2132603.1 Exodeoxyribonuclease I subunit D [Arthrobacter sp. VKM Ac-2550]
MKLLHTSDWHLGRSFHGVGMLGAQQHFIDQLVDTVRERSVDVVLIAGDVYDRALPGVDVVTMFSDALSRIRSAGARIILTSGNHDSASRLGFGSAILAHGGVHLRTRIAELATPVELELAGATLAVYGIPYLEPRLTAGELEAAAPTHTAVMRAALERVHHDLESRRAHGPVRSLVMAHTFASGGLTSDSERDLSIGGVGAIPLDLFDGLDYVALGHLHGRQELSRSVRYSGSPLPYSFSEAGHHKGGILLEFDQEGLAGAENISWDTGRRLAVLRGTMADLLESDQHAAAEDSYCQITVTDAERPLKAMERLRTRFAHTLVLAFEPEGGPRSDRLTYSERIAKAQDDLEVCCGFLDHVRSRSAGDAECGLLMETLAKVQTAEVSA